MAQTNYTPIQLYYSTTAAAIPTAGNLLNGELAINITDGKIYYKNNSGVVTLFGSTGDVSTISFGSTGLTPATATGGAITVAGTLVTANGGTGLSSFASGDIMYYSSGTSMSKLTIGSANQILTSSGTAPQWTTLTGVAVTTFSAGTTGLTPSSATSGAITLAGTLNVANGGTGLTSLTGGYIPYGNGTSAFGSTANLFWDNANVRLGVGTATPSLPIEAAGTTSNIFVGSTSTTGASGYRSSSTGGQFLFGIDASDGGYFNTGVAYGRALYSTGAYAISIFTNATQRMNIGATGLIGVNTTSQTSMFQVAGSSSVSAIKTPNIAEVDTISATAATGTINFDITTQSVLYYTSNASANWTVNFRGSSGTSLNTLMQTGESISATFLVTQGSTAYYNSAVTIDGNSVTPKWQGGSAPTSGNASSVDCYTYVIQKTGSATFAVLASQTKFA